MRKFILDFLRRGSVASGLGPIILAIIYLILRQSVGLTTLTADQVCVGILSLTGLAFIAGGMNAVYQIERLPLMAAVSIHGGVLYISYLLTYLLNDWLEWGTAPILVFTAIFVLGYFIIWAVIYAIIKRRTAKLNDILKKNRSGEADLPGQ